MYFYRNYEIKEGGLTIIQNVKGGTLEESLAVSYRWVRDRVNLGFTPDLTDVRKKVSYIIYNENGEEKLIERGILSEEELCTVIMHTNGKYSALLFL